MQLRTQPFVFFLLVAMVEAFGLVGRYCKAPLTLLHDGPLLAVVTVFVVGCNSWRTGW